MKHSRRTGEDARAYITSFSNLVILSGARQSVIEDGPLLKRKALFDERLRILPAQQNPFQLRIFHRG